MPGPGHEESDVGFRPLVIFIAALAGSLVVVSLVVAVLFRGLERATSERETGPNSRSTSEPSGVTEPRLQVSARADMEALRLREDEWLHGTAWVDEPNGVVRMPIERAMELVVERGFPNWPEADVTPPTETSPTQTLEPPATTPAGVAP
jgi:hypothetical protein